jgi:hypothetical protein
MMSPVDVAMKPPDRLSRPSVRPRRRERHPTQRSGIRQNATGCRRSPLHHPPRRRHRQKHPHRPARKRLNPWCRENRAAASSFASTSSANTAASARTARAIRSNSSAAPSCRPCQRRSTAKRPIRSDTRGQCVRVFPDTAEFIIGRAFARPVGSSGLPTLPPVREAQLRRAAPESADMICEETAGFG